MLCVVAIAELLVALRMDVEPNQPVLSGCGHHTATVPGADRTRLTNVCYWMSQHSFRQGYGISRCTYENP